MNKKFRFIYYNGEPSKYVINKKGIIKNVETGHIMRQRLNVNGYYIVRLSFEKYKRKEVFVHKLLAEAFLPNPLNKPQIHHKDKNKLNNSLNNLMWVTAEEHYQLHKNDDNHPFASCEKHSRSTLKNNEVHQICLFIEQNKYTQSELAKMFNVSREVISGIRFGLTWKQISSLYDFSNYTKKGWEEIDNDTVKSICDEIVMGNKFDDIKTKYNISDYSLRNIYHKTAYKDITDKYNFRDDFLKVTRKSSDFYNEMDNLINKGIGPKEICERMNIPYNSANKMLIHRRKIKISK